MILAQRVSFLIVRNPRSSKRKSVYGMLSNTRSGNEAPEPPLVLGVPYRLAVDGLGLL